MKTVVIENKSKELLDTLQVKQLHAENALLKIQELVDIPCTDINTLTKAFITSFVAQKIGEVSRTTFLTSDVKTSLIQDWKTKEKTAIKCIKEIQEFDEACSPQAVVTIEDGELVTSLSLKEIADSRSTMIVPEKASEHFKLLQMVREAISTLREFEEVEDLRPMNIGRACNITEDELSLLWVNGDIRIDHRWDHLIERAERQGRLINIGR